MPSALLPVLKSSKEAVTATADTNEVTEDSTLTVDAAHGVLANDTHGDDDAIHVTTTGNLTGSLGGTVVMAADGSYSYAPPSIAGIENHQCGKHRIIPSTRLNSAVCADTMLSSYWAS